MVGSGRRIRGKVFILVCSVGRRAGGVEGVAGFESWRFLNIKTKLD